MTEDLMCVGEVLVDMFGEQKRPGGAPLNVAIISSFLGVDSGIISAVGEDEKGTLLKKTIQETGITDMVTVNETRPTGYAKVETNKDNEPHFTLGNNVAYDYLNIGETASTSAERASILYVGTLGQRSEHSRKHIHDMIVSSDGMIFHDINLREGVGDWSVIFCQTLPYVNVLKVSEGELHRLAEYFSVSEDDVAELLFNESERLDKVFVTRGRNGAEVFTRNGVHQTANSPVLEVNDTTGCGDAFCAGVIYSIIKEEPPRMNLQRGVEVASVIARFKGAIPEKERFTQQLRDSSTLF